MTGSASLTLIDAKAAKKGKEPKAKTAKAEGSDAKAEGKPQKAKKEKADKGDAEAAKADAKEDMTGSKFTGGDERFSFPGAEVEVLEYWKKIDAFQTSLKLSEGRPECV